MIAMPFSGQENFPEAKGPRQKVSMRRCAQIGLGAPPWVCGPALEGSVLLLLWFAWVTSGLSQARFEILSFPSSEESGMEQSLS